MMVQYKSVDCRRVFFFFWLLCGKIRNIFQSKSTDIWK